LILRDHQTGEFCEFKPVSDGGAIPQTIEGIGPMIAASA
jgi:hypothetical protein